jgi:hypothetical protein
MTKLEALALIQEGLRALMDSDRPSRDYVAAIECSLDGTADDCELIIDFTEETDNEVEKKRTSFLIRAEEIGK